MGTQNAKPFLSAASRFTPKWFAWAVPACLLTILIAASRIDARRLNGPAELVRMANLSISKQNWAEALQVTEQLLQLYPRSHIYLAQAALMSAKLQDPRRQASYLERFLAESPTPSEACPELTHAYWRAHEIEKMLTAARRCHDLAPDDSDLTFDLALANERGGRKEEALAIYADGQRLYPEYTDFTIGHARLLLRTGKAAEAWAEVSPLLETKPGLSDVELVAALSAEKLGEIQKARSILDHALEAHPDNADLKEAAHRMQSQVGAQ